MAFELLSMIVTVYTLKNLTVGPYSVSIPVFFHEHMKLPFSSGAKEALPVLVSSSLMPA